jgi:hypothetical protein
MSVFTTRETADVGETTMTEVKARSASSSAGTPRHCGDPESDGEIVAGNISCPTAYRSPAKDDRLIADLQTLRDRLQLEGERVRRDIVEYATLSQAAMQSTRIIAESLTHWKKVPDAPSISE